MTNIYTRPFPIGVYRTSPSCHIQLFVFPTKVQPSGEEDTSESSLFDGRKSQPRPTDGSERSISETDRHPRPRGSSLQSSLQRGTGYVGFNFIPNLNGRPTMAD